ncbi:MAG: PP2C family protein-serine/threonine phosphatase [Acidobacteriota bacterium]
MAEDGRLAGGIKRAKRFAAEFTDGLDSQAVRQLFDRDATQAFRALADRRDDRPLPESLPERFFCDVRDVFLGFVFKLSPARRLLFTVSLLCPFFAAFDVDMQLGPTHIHLDFTPLWFLVGFLGMILLLALELVDRLRVRDELEVARELQRDLLPRDVPPIPGYRVAHSYRTANEIGGDYYAFHPLDPGRVAIAGGDARGHGMAAGLLMAIANATLAAAALEDPQPEAVLAAVNRTLVSTGGRRAFMTLFYGILDPSSGQLEYANAGHPFPLLRRAVGPVEELGTGALPLGLREDTRYRAANAVLRPGDLLVLYSDGIPEAVDPSANAFGFDRLKRLAAQSGSADSIHDRVLEAVAAHVGDGDLHDDLTLVVLDRVSSV